MTFVRWLGCAGLSVASCSSPAPPDTGAAPAEAGAGTQPQRYGGQPGHYEVLTHHYDNQRQGVQSFESHFRPSNVAGMALRATANLGDGYPAQQRYPARVYAQPLYARGVGIGGAHQDVVYVADTNAQIWAFTPSLDLVAGLPGGNPRQLEEPWNPGTAGGVMGTPVIDAANNRMYVVTNSDQNTGDPAACPGTGAFFLHSLDLGTMLDDDGTHGAPRVQICASATNAGVTNVFQADRHYQRPALLLNGSYLYVTFGSSHTAAGGEGGTCQHGWVMTYDVGGVGATSAPKLAGVYVSSRFADPEGCPSMQLNNIGNVGIWMSGTGPAADYAGNVYVMTSNGLSDPANDANALVQLSPSGARMSMYQTAYPNYATGADLDFGSAGPIVVDPAEARVIGSGKLGYANVLATSSMQPVSPSDVLVSSPQWRQVDPTNCSTVPMCDDAGVPNGGPIVCCPYGCDGPDAVSAWNLINGRMPGMPQPLCGPAITSYSVGTWSNPVFWNNRVYFWPQSDFLTYVPWDPVQHSFAGTGAPVRVGNLRLPAFDVTDRTTCTFGMPHCQVSGSSDGNIILSVNQEDATSAVIFAATWAGYDGLTPTNELGALYAFDANDVDAGPVWTANDMGLWRNFTYPVVADGGLYVMNAGRHTDDGWWPPQLLLYY